MKKNLVEYIVGYIFHCFILAIVVALGMYMVAGLLSAMHLLDWLIAIFIEIPDDLTREVIYSVIVLIFAIAIMLVKKLFLDDEYDTSNLNSLGVLNVNSVKRFLFIYNISVAIIIGIIIIISIQYTENIVTFRTFYYFAPSLIFCSVYKIATKEYFAMKDMCCEKCKLLNTFKHINTDSKASSNIYDKFETHGGYNLGHSADVKDSSGNYIGSFDYDQYIPKTTTYIGKYQDVVLTHKYKCKKCGHIKHEYENTKKYIGR